VFKWGPCNPDRNASGRRFTKCKVYPCRQKLIGRICGLAAKPHPVIAERNISSDAGTDPDNLVVDGSQLEGDAQAALDPNYDPPT
jgi:hypothetical protein